MEEFRRAVWQHGLANGIATGHVSIMPKDGAFAGLSRSGKKGFDFGGNLNLTTNFLPDQGSTVGHLAAFVSQTPKTNPIEAGIGPSLAGTVWVCLGCALFALRSRPGLRAGCRGAFSTKQRRSDRL